VSGSGEFPTTHWTLVITAAANTDPEADQALADLCRAYWQPLYAFVHRRGYSSDQAQDLTQEFFARLIEKRYLARADPARGRFRSFLLSAMKHFLADEYDGRQAQKRGGTHVVLSIQSPEPDGFYKWEPRDDETPEKIFDREWALTLLSRVTGHLRASFVREGRETDFDRLKQFLPGNERELSYAEAARLLGASEGAAKVAVHRLRRRYRELLRAEIAHTVADSGDIESEIRYLLEALAS
jgi:RNA polymerase sigma-70 factor (ECF subfamily)